jgi:3-hydroxyacyl-[acyl-carrier-protein] dehydratase
MKYDIDKIKDILPHRYPLLLVDRITYTDENHVVGYKNITINEQIFNGHFPDFPIYPGVMIVEGMAQVGAILAYEYCQRNDINFKDKLIFFASIDNCKFRQPVRPGDKLEYKIETTNRRNLMWMLGAKAYVDDKLVAQAELKATIRDKNV